jgi:hypothetical protein
MATSVRANQRGRKNAIIRIRLPKVSYHISSLRPFGRIFVFLAILVVPALYSSAISYSGEFPKFVALMALSIALGGIFLLSTMISPVNRFVQSPILTLVILFLLGYIASAICSSHPIASIFGNRGTWSTSIIGIMGASVIAIVSCNIFRKKQSAYHLLVYLTLSGFFTAILFLGAKYLLPALNIEKDLSSFLPIPNMTYLSGFLLIAISANAAVLLDPLAKHIRPAIGVVLATQVGALLAAGSILSIVIGLLSCVPLAISVFSRRKTMQRRGRILFFAGMVLFGLLSVAVLFPTIYSRLPQTIQEQSYVESVATEIQSWKPAFTIFSKHVFTGTGPELLNSELLSESKDFTQRVISSSLTPYSFSSAYATILATTGLLGTVPLVLITMFCLSALIRHETRPNYESKAFLYVSLVFLLSLLVHPFSSLTLLTGFAVLGVGAAHIPPVHLTIRNHNPARRYQAFIVVGILIYLGYSLFAFTRAEQLFMRSTQEAFPQNLQSATDATRYNSYDSAYHRARTGFLIQYLQRNTERQNSSEVVRQIQQSIDTTLILNPYDYLNLFTASQAYGDLAIILDHHAYNVTALSYITAAIDESPYDQRLYLARGLLFLRMDNLSAATIDFDKAVSIDDEMWLVYLSSAQLLQQAGKFQESVPYLEKIIESSHDIQYVQKAQTLLEKVPVVIGE